MFDFFLMADNYEDRAIDRFEKDDLVIDTCAVSDGDKPFETGVTHPDYNGGYWIVVEAYETKEAAKDGHARWIDTMTGDLPVKLSDCRNSKISQFFDE